MLARARAGLPLGRLPLGDHHGILAAVLSEPAASVIRNVFRWVSDEGVSAAEARRRAEESGLRDTSGPPLTAASFLRLVRNPFYAGYVRGFDELHDGMLERAH